MPRSATDRQPQADTRRAQQYARIERALGKEGSHPASKTLWQRPATRDTGRRMAEFMRIERGQVV